MLGASTCWRSGSITGGIELAREMARLGLGALELDFRLSSSTLKQLLAECGPLGMSVVSIHGVCPHAGAGAGELSDKDGRLRANAVSGVIKTIELAAETGARAVVIHCGGAPMEKVTLELQNMYDAGLAGSAEYLKLLNGFRIERLKRRGTDIDRLLLSLDRINEAAEKAGVDVGLENRYYLREYPGFEEMAVILFRMAGSRIKYWHDAGHAQVQQNLGIVPHEAWLKEFSGELIGVHLHGVDGYTDHNSPCVKGHEDVDYNMLAKYLKPETIRIIELRTDVTPGQALSGIEYLKTRGVA